MKLLVTILLLSIQAMPAQARGSKIISKLAEFLDWDSWSSEEEGRTSLGQDQPRQFEGILPDSETYIFTDKPQSASEYAEMMKRDNFLFDQELNSRVVITLAPGREFYLHDNYIINTAGLDPKSDVKGAWGTSSSQYEDLGEEVIKIWGSSKMKSLPVPAFHHNLANLCQMDLGVILEEQQIDPLAKLLQNRKDSSAPHSYQSMSIFLDHSFTKCL